MRPKGLGKMDLEVRRRTAVKLVINGGFTHRQALLPHIPQRRGALLPLPALANVGVDYGRASIVVGTAKPQSGALG